MTIGTLKKSASLQGRSLFAGLLGNVLDHYDTALYGFLAPFIAPLIFPETSFINALIKTYGLMSLSLITRPLGAWYFGRYSQKYGLKASLSKSLIGLSVITFAMGLLPSYETAHEIAPIMLSILRLLQGFFGAGESSLAPFFIIGFANKKKRGLMDSIYGSTVVLGELLASLAALLVSVSDSPWFYWRIPFLLSAFTGLIGIILRRTVVEDEIKRPNAPPFDLWSSFKCSKLVFAKIIAVSGMSYITYAIPFVFFNNFIPHITSITLSDMMMLNTSLLALDMLLAPLFGLLADRVEHWRFMLSMALLLFIFALPIFYFLSGASQLFVTLSRIFIVLIGLGFSAPMHAWFMTQLKGPEFYALTGIAYAIGSQTLGRTTPALCLFLYQITNNSIAPAFYIMFVCSLALMALFKAPRTSLST